MVTESLKSNVVASQVFDSITANFETLGLQTFKVHEIDKGSDPWKRLTKDRQSFHEYIYVAYMILF